MDVPEVIAGRFGIECEIGRGGMGTVYRATHLGLDRPVAVKSSSPSLREITMSPIGFCARLGRWPNFAIRTLQ